MKFFRDLKIVKKLFCYYAVILIGVLVLSYFSIEDIYHIDRYYYEASALTQSRLEYIFSAQSNLVAGNLNGVRDDLNRLNNVSQMAVQTGIGGFHSIRHDIYAALVTSHQDMQAAIARANSLDESQTALLDAELRNLVTISFNYMNAVRAENHSEVSQSIINKFAIIFGVVAIVTMLTYFLSKTISTPLKNLEQVVGSIAKGNIDVNFDSTRHSKDEIGMLAQSVYELDHIIKNIVGDLNATYHQYIEVGNIHYQTDESKYQNSYKEMISLVNKLTAQVTDDVTEISNIMGKIVEGNFNQNIDRSIWVGEWRFVPDVVEKLEKGLNDVTSEVNSMIKAIADRGDLSFQIDSSLYKGDWSKIMLGLNGITKAVNAPLRVMEIAMEEMKVGNFDVLKIDDKITAEGFDSDAGAYNGMFKNLIDVAETSISEMFSYISEIENILSEVAGGNLHSTIEREYVGSFNIIRQSVNSIVVRLNETVTDISDVANGVSSGSAQLSQSSMDLSEGVSKQMVSMQEMTEGISLVDTGAKGNSENAQRAAELAITSKENAEAGNSEMEHLLNAMERINVSANEISKIISTIEGIAFQTNLLALNAAVEAARAGEHGKGFSVVAEEVRSLAARSAEAAQQTAGLIQESINNVNDGKKAASDTAESLGKIVQNVQDVSAVIDEIFDSSTKQTKAIGGINNDLQQISQIVQSSAATSEETAASAEELDAQVSILKDKLSFFSTSLVALSVTKVWDATTSDSINISSLRDIPGERKKFTTGDVIVQEGDTSVDSMYFVLEGSVKVAKGASSLNEKHLATLKAGDLFGEMALFLNEPRTASVVANSNVTVVEVQRSTLAQFVKSSPDTANAIIETLCRRLKNVLADIGSY